MIALCGREFFRVYRGKVEKAEILLRLRVEGEDQARMFAGSLTLRPRKNGFVEIHIGELELG